MRSGSFLLLRLGLGLILLLFHCALLSQEVPSLTIKEIGTPFINTYLPTDYGAHEQNFEIVQSPDGLMYIANVTGVIEFDGFNWNVDSRVSDDSFKAVTIGNDNLVYGTTKSLIGRFRSDSLGRTQFESLGPKLPADLLSFGDVRSVDALGDLVIYRSRNALLLYHIVKDTFKVITSQDGFGLGSVIDSEFYVVDHSKGLMQLEGESLELLSGSESLKSKALTDMVRFSDDELLFLTKGNGFLRYDFKAVHTWETSVSEYIRKHDGFAAINIYDRYYAVGTGNGGVVIIDEHGKLIQKLNKEMGMGADGLIQDLYLDKDDNLWVAQHGALHQVILNSPFTTIDDRHGVNGYVLYFQNWHSRTYVSTATGIVVKDQDSPWQSLSADYKPFKPISDDQQRVWMTIKHGDDFFSAGNRGLIQITDDGLKSLLNNGERMWAAVAMRDSKEMIIGSIEGNLHRFVKVNGEWRHDNRIKGFNKQMDFLEQTPNGGIWMTDSGTGVFKIKLNEKRDSVLSVKMYGPEQGLPELERNRVFRHSDGLYFATASGVYQYNASSDSFYPSEKFNQHLSEDYVFRLIEMKNGDVYGSLNPRGKSLMKRTEDGYDFTQVPFQRIAGHNSEYVSGMGGNNIWIAGTGIKHYAGGYEHKPSKGFAAYIRSVEVSNKNDSLIYSGGDVDRTVELRPNENAVQFEYSASYYDKIEEIEFQSYLEGSEETWAPWSSKSSRNYTNLRHGTYTFKVRARNLYGDVSAIGEYTFTIYTPWYLTVWAFLLYAILVTLSVWSIVKLNTRRLEKEKLRLEATIYERTEEIRRQKEKAEADKLVIQEQADRLKELDKVKSRFFANISHELRTPLTLINAPLESLIEGGKIEDEEIRETLITAKRNGVSLLSLVEEILDLAKLEAGKLKLVENPVRLREFLGDILGDYITVAKSRGIEIKFNFWPDKNLTVLLDENKTGKVIRNLLSNALKFTRNHIELRLQYSPDEPDRAQLSVIDNGVGIDAQDLPFIFNRYYQSERPDKKAEGGTGIGLALANELAELQAGRLTVESQPNEETIFTLEFPLKEVKEETIVPLTQADSENLDKALKDTITRYGQKFELEKPVLLITEDHPEMRAFIAKTLTPYFDILQAENGKLALEILETQTVDIVISDVMMPIMDGFELLEAIKKNERLRQVSVVMLTARADQEDRLHALTLGIDDYLTKPFSAALFLARIKNILENRIKVIRAFKELAHKESNGAQSNVAWLIKEHDLSEREVEVMRLLAKRYTNAEISERLFVSQNTVKYHIKNLFIKLNVKSRKEAADKIGEHL
ncbi:hypothetical protein BFP97_07595 [Roseivirga sp. 4D4]|uniref:response regulator n=1 Tax=Roseivirga sp. 4D4 TaxID=1889784 RepID=UPI000853987F|nr:response regulator [Roseivirga sp. 4D4]OEK01389.1 hypothetical protein BFP97_07595 [Roseivirga sp. 4D4]